MDVLAAHISFDTPCLDDTGGGTEVPEPTSCGPGTIGKVYVVMRRALANQALWHSADAIVIDKFGEKSCDIVWPQQMLLPWEKKKRKHTKTTNATYWYAFDWHNVATILRLYHCIDVQVFIGAKFCGYMLKNKTPVLTFHVPAKSAEPYRVRVLSGRKVGDFVAGERLTALQQAAAIGLSFWPIESISLFKDTTWK